MTPKLGMHFDDLDEAYNFYNGYGKLAGFSVRKESTNRGKDGEVVWKRFVCSKQGLLMLSQASHLILTVEVEKALMKNCYDLQLEGSITFLYLEKVPSRVNVSSSASVAEVRCSLYLQESEAGYFRASCDTLFVELDVFVLSYELGGTSNKDEGLLVPSLTSSAKGNHHHLGNLLAENSNAICYQRVPKEILRIMYGKHTAGVLGGFFPNGANGQTAKFYLHNSSF
ncbi:hypothetical protein MRB53_016349 [Persea americana]|uniref:Uncharacterized protein n=1 Tax=Persea americana TaxID=3435 RepID=A0ACC2M1W6_PERAE|nr:hypothetical protein MRB53_016349 [Persea americana]